MLKKHRKTTKQKIFLSPPHIALKGVLNLVHKITIASSYSIFNESFSCSFISWQFCFTRTKSVFNIFQIKALKILLTNRYRTCIIVVCGFKSITKSGSISKNPKVFFGN